MPEHVYLTPIPDSTSESTAFISRNIPSHVVVSRTPFCTLFILSVFPVKNSYAAQAHFERAGTVNWTPVLAACQVCVCRLSWPLAKSRCPKHLRKENFWQH